MTAECHMCFDLHTNTDTGLFRVFFDIGGRVDGYRAGKASFSATGKRGLLEASLISMRRLHRRRGPVKKLGCLRKVDRIRGKVSE